MEANFLLEKPLLATKTEVVGLTPLHTDVTFWYLLRGDSAVTPKYDPREFNEVKWYGFDEIPFEKSDPHMRRFVNKYKNADICF